MSGEKKTTKWEASAVIGIEALVAGIVFDIWAIGAAGVVLIAAAVVMWQKTRRKE